MDIRDVARQALEKAVAEMVPFAKVHQHVADAVAVAVLQEVKALADKTEQDAIAHYRRVGGDRAEGAMDMAGSLAILIHDRLAAFTPAEPPQQETEVLRAPTTEAETVADPRDDFPGYPDAVQRAYMDQLDWNK